MIGIADANLLFVKLNPANVSVPLAHNPLITGFGVIAKGWGSGPTLTDAVENRAAVRRRHNDRYNLGFCDGHLEAREHDRLYEDSDTARRIWNRDNEP
jgi:prepilin-type processing-associated H-X9-DG protein